MQARKFFLYILRSWAGWTLACSQLVSFMTIWWAYGPFLGNDKFHFINEPILTKVFVLLNFPAMMVAGFILNPLVFFLLALDIRDRSYMGLDVALTVVTVMIQWNLIGALIQRLGEYLFRKRSLLR